MIGLMEAGLVAALVGGFVVSVIVVVRGVAGFKPFEVLNGPNPFGGFSSTRLVLFGPTVMIGLVVATSILDLFEDEMDVEFLKFKVAQVWIVLGAQFLMIGLAKRKKREARQAQSKPLDLSGR